LVGGGDSGKTSVLDAIELVFAARSNVTFDDTDFYAVDPKANPITVTVTFGDLPADFLKDERYGLYARGWNEEAQKLEDEPDEESQGLENVISVRLTVDHTLEPEWTLFNDRVDKGELNPRALNFQDRQDIAPSRLGPYADRHLSWGRQSVLNRITKGASGSRGLLAESGRVARQEFSKDSKQLFTETIDRAKVAAQRLGVPIGDDLRAMLDVQAIGLSGGGIGARHQLETGGQVDLSDAPACVTRISPVSLSKNDIRKANVKAGLKPELRDDETLIVIGDKASEVMRASLASKIKCTSIEPVACRSLAEFIAGLNSVSGKPRLKLVLDFAENVMTGVQKTPFERRVHRLSTGWLGKKTRTDAELAALGISASEDLKAVLNLLEVFRRQAVMPPHRRELLSATCNALRLVVAGEQVNLESAVWYVQNKARHAGRRLARRSVGSTLLVKGLQFDHAVIKSSRQTKQK
jgi:hypothetical protein